MIRFKAAVFILLLLLGTGCSSHHPSEPWSDLAKWIQVSRAIGDEIYPNLSVLEEARSKQTNENILLIQYVLDQNKESGLRNRLMKELVKSRTDKPRWGLIYADLIMVHRIERMRKRWNQLSYQERLNYAHNRYVLIRWLKMREEGIKGAR